MMALSRMPMQSIDSHPNTITIQAMRPLYQNNVLSVWIRLLTLRQF